MPRTSQHPEPSLLREKEWRVVACVRSLLRWNLCHPAHIRCHPGVRPIYQQRSCVPSTRAQGHIGICRTAISLPEKAPSQHPSCLPRNCLSPSQPREAVPGWKSLLWNGCLLSGKYFLFSKEKYPIPKPTQATKNGRSSSSPSHEFICLT